MIASVCIANLFIYLETPSNSIKFQNGFSHRCAFYNLTMALIRMHNCGSSQDLHFIKGQLPSGLL